MLPDPKMPTTAYTTFGIRAPFRTHFRPATCEEVDCPEWRYGYKLRWDILNERDRYLLTHCGRKYKVDQEWIIFEPGQPCLRSSKHRTRIDKPEMFLKKNLHLSTPSGGQVYRHKNAADWTDDFLNTTDKAVEEIQKG